MFLYEMNSQHCPYMHCSAIADCKASACDTNTCPSLSPCDNPCAYMTGCTGPACNYSCTEPSCNPPQLTIKLNPTVVPSKFTRYRHPSHKHKLFMVTGLSNHRCDNENCRKNICRNETIFSCFRCNFDLCDMCFQLNTVESEIPLAQDDIDVNETTVKHLPTILSVRVTECFENEIDY